LGRPKKKTETIEENPNNKRKSDSARSRLQVSTDTGVTRNFDWGWPKLEKKCDVILVTFFSDVMVDVIEMTSCLFFGARIRHNQLEEPQIWLNHETSGHQY